MPTSFVKFLTCVLLIAASAFLATAQSAQTDIPQKGKYRSIEVQKLDVAPDVDIPSNQINVIFLEIVDELHKIKKFDRVTKAGSKSAENTVLDAQPRLRLEGTISRYSALVPQKYTTKTGDIWTRVKIQVKFIDTSDGKILLEKEVDRRIFFGVYQFTLDDVGRKVAKEVAKIAKKTFF
ncbi:MAG: hypothetical protein ACKVQW_04450 [Pyrinomonadaceae bacterium]